MPTNAARFQAIGDAVLNKTATVAQLARCGEALAYNAGESEAYAAMTQGQQAAYAVNKVYRYLVDNVKRMDVKKAEEANAATAAAVDTEFGQTP